MLLNRSIWVHSTMGLTKINIVKQNYSHLGNEWSNLTKLYKMTAAVNRSIIVYIYIQQSTIGTKLTYWYI